MTSRPALGTHGNGAPCRNQARRPSKPANILPTADCIDPSLDDDRPSAHNGASDARPPPRGRPQLFFNTLAANGMELPHHPFPYQPSANLPAPPRPSSAPPRDASNLRRILLGGTGVKDPLKLASLELAPAPVQLPGGMVADVFPWTGNNPEDVLTEALVKAGVSNKPQIMNETNTARPSLWSNLKNKSGITTLSTLFVAVLEKRQQSGRLTTPNTFKPPPRLTLRDSTREAWLHDLANPTVSLRRLSRTIPHGLTGRVLLEQCLNKNIPLPRALWLAKCVGINELRAHKRKGQAGTVTWGRGWTSSVEQFLDSVIHTIGHGDWKPRVTYAVQLATCLYKEHLLDNDHFIDWILTGLNTCPTERLFIWLLLVSVSHYWTDITSCRQRGKRLAESLLNYLTKLYQVEDQPAISTALEYLENTTLKLLATRPECLLLPTSWLKHGPMLKALAEKRNQPQISDAVRKIEARNGRLLQSSRVTSSASQTPTARLFRKLDSIDYKSELHINDLAYECMEIISNATQLISLLLQWACSLHRTGSHRVYLATRLLRRWNSLGADVYEGIISYLQNMAGADSGDLAVVLRIVAELVRSKHFQAGRYLQWLIATGAVACDTKLALPDSWPILLLTGFPLTGLPDQVRNLRSTLLRGTAHSAESEEHALNLTKHSIAQAVPAIFNLNSPSPTPTDYNVLEANLTVKLELGIWLRHRVAQHAAIIEHVPTKDPSILETAAVSQISCFDYHMVRSYLEQYEDLAILADVICITTSSLDSAVLASVADTLNYHMKAFRAIGAFDPLFRRMATRYAGIRTIRFPERELILSLQNLARTAQPDGQLLQLLGYDLGRLDQKNSIAACSPASDNMGEVMQHMGTCSDDEIERILSSGTSMDQQMMARVLRKIVRNLEEHMGKNYLQVDSYPTWFWRLRNFDEPTFDVVLHEWLDSCLTNFQVYTLRIAVPSLVASGSMVLSNFMEILRACLTKAKRSQLIEPSASAIEGLRILLPSKGLAKSCSPQDAYRYRLEQHRLCFESDIRILTCIGEVAELVYSMPSGRSQQELSTLLCSEPILSIAKHHIGFASDCLSRLKIENPGWASTNGGLKLLLDSLLDPAGRLRLANMNSEEQVFAVFKVASELSLPICQAVIEHIFSSESMLDGAAVDVPSGALLNAVKIAVEEGQSQGLELLTTLDTALMDKIRYHAERKILDTSSFLTNTSITNSSDNKPMAALVQKYLMVVDFTSSKSTETLDQPTILAALVERLDGISQAYSSFGATDDASDQAIAGQVFNMYAWLNALLRLAVAHGSALLRNATHTHQIAFMGAMEALLVHSVLESYPLITEHIFDVAIVLSDHLSDEARHHIARLESARTTSCSRRHFILGAASSVDGWLVLTKPMNLPLNTQTTSQPSTPITAQTQSLTGPQISASGPATPHQRYINQQQQQLMQQRQHMPQAQQSQQNRKYPQYSQHSMQTNRQLPGQLQRTPSYQASPSPLQQMQHMQQMQGLAQQRATQPSPVQSQRMATTINQGGSGGPVGGASNNKPQVTSVNHSREFRQYPFVQPRWEVLAESSGNPNLNETAINLGLFGARKA